MNSHTRQLNEYRDKVYVYNVLTSKAADFYGTLKSFVNIPIIISSSAMSIINSSFEPNDMMKIANIVLNCTVALMMSMISNFKITEKAANFRNISLKFLKLLHNVDDKLSTPDIDIEDVREITRQYDELLEQMDQIPEFIKKRVYKLFVGKKYLPIILCEGSQDMSPTPSKPVSASITTEGFAL
jgi:hypothetical protein